MKEMNCRNALGSALRGLRISYFLETKQNPLAGGKWRQSWPPRFSDFDELASSELSVEDSRVAASAVLLHFSRARRPCHCGLRSGVETFFLTSRPSGCRNLD